MDRRRSAKAFSATAAVCVAAAALVLPIQAAGQARSGRTIFRCESAGHISYTDAPCPHAEKVDPVRLRGVNPPATPDRTAYAPGDLTGATYAMKRSVNAEPRAARVAPGSNPECPHLAQRMARVETEEQVANAHNIGLIQQRLAEQRHWYQQLGCDTFVASPRPAGSTQSSNPQPGRDYAG
jgi:hypothetical protein